MPRQPSAVAGRPADAAVPRGELRLHQALDALREALWLLDAERDADGRITDFRIADLNNTAAELAGLDIEAVRGGRFGDLVPLARRLGHIDRYAAIVASGHRESFEFSAPGADGTKVWRRLNAARSGDGVVVIVSDITAEKARERERAAAEDDLRLLAENASDMIARITPQGRVTFISPACEEIMGYAPEEIVGRLDQEFVHPGDLPALAVSRRHLEAGPEPGPSTYRVRRKQGGWVWLEASSRGVRDADGALTEIQVATRDVTERMLSQAEHAALHRVSEAVAENIDPADLHLLVAAEMANLLDADGGRVVRYIDDGTVEVLGAWRRASLPPTRSGELLLLSPTWAIAQVRATGTTSIAELTSADAADAGAGLRMGIAAPVRLGGRVWGAVAAAFRDPGDAPVGTPMRVERFAKLVELAVANADARARLTVQATTDALTGLANHGTFHAALAEEFARTSRYGRPLSLAVIDLDLFKTLNDTFGHRAGDAALATVGSLLRDHARQADVVGRIGGEELGWLMPETDAAGALEAADRLRRAIAAAPICGPLGITASIGVARRTQLDQDPDHLFRRADSALYQAKENGRDRVVIAG
jgi:diguanylate cyclase (GGDEF)-like protein/PAS domain S-box-containing protein